MAANFDFDDNPDWFDDHPGNTAGGGNYVEPDAPVDPPDSGDPFGINRIAGMVPPAPGTGGTNTATGNSGYNDQRPGLPDLSKFKSPDPLAPWTETFTAPTAEEAMKTPGFQFQLGQGMQALQRSAAAKGTLLTGGTAKGLEDYAINTANTHYGDVYNKAYNEYEGRRSNFLTNEANRYNSQRSNLNDQWGINSDYFNMGRANREDDFNIFNTGRNFDYRAFDDNRNYNRGLNDDYFKHYYDMLMATKPPAPSGA